MLRRTRAEAGEQQMQIKRTLLVAAGLWALVGCGGSPLSSGGMGGAGVTPGGGQDMGLAREKIANGMVPAPEDFLAEGLYSEHDLPLDGPACAQTLCLRGAAAVAPAVDTLSQETFLQLGMASNVDLSTFKRPALNAALVIDRSGSMSGGRLENVKAAAKALVDHLGPEDLLTLVTFNSDAKHVFGPTAVTDRAALKAQIDDFKERGGTCIECGLREAEEALRGKHGPQRQTRIFLFTDAQPNVGATGEGEFTQLMEQYAAADVFLTTFGVGLGFGQELVTRMSAVKGANAFFLEDGDPTRRVFDEDFDLLVTPVAFDFTLEVLPAASHTLVASYGIPAQTGAASATQTVKTLFLSRRRGAIVVRLSGSVAPSSELATLKLGYTPVGGAPVQDTLRVDFQGAGAPGEGESWFASTGVRKTVALTQFLIGARAASEAHYAGQKDEAVALAERTANLLTDEAEALGDAGLRQEAELAAALLALLRG